MGIKMEKYTILVTGQNGFLGSHIINNLYKDYNIIGLDISSSDNFRVKEILPNITSYFTDKDKLDFIFEKHKINSIIHTATNFGKDGDFVKIIDSNIRFPLELIQLGIKHKVKAFINTDTFYQPNYGALQYYSLTKGQFCEWMKLLSNTIKIVNLRIGVIFGPKDNRDKFSSSIIGRMLANETEIDLTEGFQKRNYLFVEEAARIYRTVIEKIDDLKFQFNSFNIGSGESTSIRDFVMMIHKLSKSKSKLNFGAIEYRENEIMDPDNNINELIELGWKPALSLEEALLKTIDYEKSLL